MTFLRTVLCGLVLLSGSHPAWSGVHLWRVKEIFSNASGTVQFIELATCCGSTGENFLANQQVTSTGSAFVIPSNVAGSTLNKHLLLATADFAALTGAPVPNYIIPDNFISTGGDTITFAIYDTLIFAAGVLPTDGTTSLNKNPNDATDTTFTALNSPTNYAGQTGSVTVVSGAPAVPDGGGGTTPMTVRAMDADASTLEISFDVGSCMNAADHHVIYGDVSGLPPAPGGIYTPLGAVCGAGVATPYLWVGAPAVDEPGELLWFILVATDDAVVEGSWGTDAFGQERQGPGNGGASGICALVKTLDNACGNH
jgi:hypothetical protein